MAAGRTGNGPELDESMGSDPLWPPHVTLMRAMLTTAQQLHRGNPQGV